MAVVGPRNLQHLAASRHGDQVIFVQETSPQDSVWGALWWKSSVQELYIWFDGWILIFFGGQFVSQLEQELSGLIEEPASKTYVLILRASYDSTLASGSFKTSVGTLLAMTIRVDGNPVSEMTNLEVTSTETDVTLSVPVAVPAGSIITMDVAVGEVLPADFAFTLGFTE